MVTVPYLHRCLSLQIFTYPLPSLKTSRRYVKYPYSPQGSQSPTSAAAPSQSTSGTHAASSVRGDVNGDGKLNIMDVLLAQRSILGLGKLRAEEIARADLNGNGKVDILDVLLMQKKILGL